jgi:hypothetical protein
MFTCNYLRREHGCEQMDLPGTTQIGGRVSPAKVRGRIACFDGLCSPNGMTGSVGESYPLSARFDSKICHILKKLILSAIKNRVSHTRLIFHLPVIPYTLVCTSIYKKAEK